MRTATALFSHTDTDLPPLKNSISGRKNVIRRAMLEADRGPMLPGVFAKISRDFN
jgi:hypothetical protein